MCLSFYFTFFLSFSLSLCITFSSLSLFLSSVYYFSLSYLFFYIPFLISSALPPLLTSPAFFQLILHYSPLSYRPTHFSHYTKQSGTAAPALSSLPLAFLLPLLPSPVFLPVLACAPYSLTFALSTGFRGQPGQSAEAAKGKHTGNRHSGRAAGGGGGGGSRGTPSTLSSTGRGRNWSR